jgi:hypothetical protein
MAREPIPENKFPLGRKEMFQGIGFSTHAFENGCNEVYIPYSSSKSIT